MTQKGLWNVAKWKMLADRGATPKDEGNQSQSTKSHAQGKTTERKEMEKRTNVEYVMCGRREVENV